MNRAEVEALVADMRVQASSMASPAGMSNLLLAGAAMLAEFLEEEKLTVEDLFAQAALGSILEDTYANDLMGDGYDADSLADEAYHIAEAMMRRRKQ